MIQVKTTLLCLLISPSQLLGQADTVTRPDTVSSPLKPIDYREIPYTYTTHYTSTVRGRSSTTYSTHTDIRRIYSYDGIDVDNPQLELWRYMDALHDNNVTEQHQLFDNMVTSRQTASSIGAAIAIPGLIMLIVGAGQASVYKKELAKQQTSYYQTPAQTPQPPTGGPTLANCSSWIGYNGSWECESGPYAGQRTNIDPFKPITPPLQVGQPIVPSGPPTRVDLPNGVGWIIGGTVAVLVGMVVGLTSGGDPNAAFLKAVQYYNRGLKQKFSWEMRPLYQYGANGVQLIGHF